ncbi:M48 family metallopeptidase [Myroides sp. 1354]|uniref:M48 family metallopeptidase n=1 Tax=unclassified Myroides TaxID=2642485 RepID=UPI00257569ED|nr:MULTISPECIES: M48 family metallopeptidase [unclassified Myroides]MDM1045444.1 M48 family metallopeptidase [Myroides sp. R163-1]MDM1056319.1 M48 family metallopeptidase [Myroides sp. 1354]MDM1069574.1 M48 family metallopeptidase [Myroides sp. 1372]
MAYVGLHTQIRRNNTKSILLLFAFPLLILLGIVFILGYLASWNWEMAYDPILQVTPIVFVVVGIWFVISYFFHNQMIQRATHAKPLERKDNMRVYNLTENLCMSVGMPMPKLFIIETEALNAFASGINQKSHSVTLTRGIIDKLDDKELEGVIAHELMHIRNNDVRLLIVTIVFVGILGVILNLLIRGLFNGLGRRRGGKDNGGAIIILILVVTLVIYFFSMVFKFALSRSREYMADAGAVSMTKDSHALASALRKISGNSKLDTTNNEVRELFIDNSDESKSKGFLGDISSIFSTHPPIEKRIEFLEKM